MNTLLSIVLAAIINPDMLGSKEVKFRDLPPECIAAYDADLKNWRKATETEVVYLDMDCDGLQEMLVWDGNTGSGGQGWQVMKKKGNQWKSLGEVFGVTAQVKHKDKNGLLVCHPLGWEEAGWEYYELQNGKLIKLFDFNVEYAESSPVLRVKPLKITIKYPEKSK